MVSANRRGRWSDMIVVGGAILLLALVGSACSEGSDAAVDDRRSAPRSSTTLEPTTTIGPTTSVPPTTSAPPVVSTSTAPPVTAIPTDQSGRIFAIVESYDLGARTVVVDVAQYLGGEDYFRYLAADPARWGGLFCGDDHFEFDGSQAISDCYTDGQEQTVVNENDRLRTLSVAPDATFTAAFGGSGESQPATEQEFADFIASGRMGDTFWLTVDDGWVRLIEFQFFS